MFFRYAAAALSAAILVFSTSRPTIVDAFLSPIGWVPPRRVVVPVTRHYVSAEDSRVDSTTPRSDDDDDESDEQLLRKVPKSQLVELCTQFNLSTKGTKDTLLKRLRDYANDQAELERQRRKERIARVEQGAAQDDTKERYEIVSDSPEDDDDDEGFFYFHVPNATAVNRNETKQHDTVTKKPTYVTNNVITAPEPPPEPNENGERVVTVYSTKDHNDLTGIAAAQPGQNVMSNDAMMTGSATAAAAPWDMTDSHRKAEASSKELEEAKETVAELVHALLTMSGAPAFRDEFSEGLKPLANGRRRDNSQAAPLSQEGFVGFDPAKVPTDILVASSQALRAGRGQVLQDVLRDYELRAVGHDGMAGDDMENGGGHYQEVCKVRAFLEGYRRAEVRRVARETTTVLLDKLVSEGIEGLDFLLASMTKSSDDTGDVGELNDALVEYLNDAIRQQEKKVEQLARVEQKRLVGEQRPESVRDDPIEALWNVTTEDGKRIETLDPNDPEVQRALEKEAAKIETNQEMLGSARTVPESAPEQLLLLLTLLRERIKTEAAFASDEKGRNLRILAYCLHVGTDKEREELIRKETGSSVDRLDSFIELVASSIEYAESTSHQLQPSRSRPLNTKLLKSILELAERMREKQSYQASSPSTKL